MLDPKVNIVRAVSLLANTSDRAGIADSDGPETPIGALTDCILFTDDGEEQMSNEDIVTLFTAIVRVVPPRVLAKMNAAANHQMRFVMQSYADRARESLDASEQMPEAA